jgi:hypothetical protein
MFIGCKGYPNCSYSIWLPDSKETNFINSKCDECKNYYLLNFVFEVGSMPLNIPLNLTICIFCDNPLKSYITFSKNKNNVNKRKSPEKSKEIVDKVTKIQDFESLKEEFSKKKKIDKETKKKELKCDHQIPVVVLTCRKEGPNKGRKFLKCSKDANSQCKFFKWEDEI